ncbi:amidohydrolase family protein [Blastococcus deserti]|uniref:Amidohydrolase family protein n=1 Tax=Blastococcus deserti TaxID=2259033 RepID=A0ABW4XET7_9ACTN
MRQIDVHQHLGPCRVFDLDVEVSQLIDSVQRTGLDGIVVQPFPGTDNAKAQHDAIAAMATHAPFEVWGIASVNPHMDADAYRQEVRRCVEELGFVGVKLHTIGHAVNPGSRDAAVVFETARELGIAVMVHTGDGVPFADPAALLGPAKDHPDLPIVLAHAGGGTFTGAALAVARECSNIYLEPSWCKTPDIGAMVELLGADRVMFGADLPFNVEPEMQKITALSLAPRDMEAVLSRTAQSVFGLA